MDNFPTLRHYVVMMLLWLPAQYRNLLDPELTWVALVIAALTGLLVVYIAVMVGTQAIRKVRAATRPDERLP
jgi:amino acid transporter